MKLACARREALSLVATAVLCAVCAVAARTPLPAWEDVALPAWAQWTTPPIARRPVSQAPLPPVESHTSLASTPLWLVVAGVLIACALLACAVRRLWAALHGSRAASAAPSLVGASEPAIRVAEVRARARAEADADLRSAADAQGAVQRCWRALEAEAAARGVPRDPAMTTDAYAALVRERLGLDAAALGTLERLYATTLYGDEAVVDPDEARACLGQLFTDQGPVAP